MTRSYSSLFFWLGLTIAASLMLYHTSDRVHALDQELHGLNSQIEAEQQSLHVLKAEWVYLSNPARVEAAARRHLDLQPTTPQRVVSLQDMGTLLPVHDNASSVPQTQIAQVSPSPAAAPQAHSQTVAHVAPAVSHRIDRVIADLNAGRINDHVHLQHTAAVEASPDTIGALIGTLGLHP